MRRELTEVRQRQGLTVERLAEHAPVICGLTAVDDELRHNPQHSRASAARSVVRCAVNNLSFPYSVIARYTLNLVDGLEPVLNKRRHALRTSVLFIASESTYFEKESATYEELAAELVSGVQSPCRVPRAHSVEQLLVEVRRVVEESNQATVERVVMTLLSHLAGVPSYAAQLAAAEALAATVPSPDLPTRPDRSDVGALMASIVQSREFAALLPDNVSVETARAQSRAMWEAPDPSAADMEAAITIHLERKDAQLGRELITEQYWQLRETVLIAIARWLAHS